jgi:hypothetical protein
LGYIKDVENEWKAHGKQVLKELGTKKIIKSTGRDNLS